MQFVGAAQQSFDSFVNLARFMLDTYWRNWNNPSDPTSYLLPPTFPFINPDKSDHDIEKIKSELHWEDEAGPSNNDMNSVQRPVIDRFSDSGEFLVFHAIWALVQDKVQAPILALHRVNLEKIKGHLKQIFPHAQIDMKNRFKAMAREYDFVLIGPKIGIILIEVKSSAFTKTRDFAAKTRHLPDQIVDGVKQLMSFEPEFFQACSGLQMPPEVRLRRILFTPNLEWKRCEAWWKNLDEAAAEKVKNLFVGNKIIHWFKGDLTNSSQDSLKPALYSRVREMIETAGFQIPQETYESYGLIITGLGSVIVLRDQPVVELCTERFSTSNAILREVHALESHDPLQKLNRLLSRHNISRSKRQKVDISFDEVVELNAKLILLTPEQQKALYGPNRQFIIGAPGTGKTIILQAKALQLLKEGRRVLVFTTKGYWKKYEILFRNHHFSKYRIYTKLLWKESVSFLNDDFARMVEDDGGPARSTSTACSEDEKDIAQMRDCLKKFDAVFIDDAFDDYTWFHGGVKHRRLSSMKQLMKLASSCQFSSKVVWVAGDSVLPDLDPECQYLRKTLDHISEEEQDFFTCYELNRVMRSSESTFRASYSKEFLRRLQTMPEIGHKIHGFSGIFNLSCLSIADARLEIWTQTEEAVKKFHNEGFDYGHIAVIVGGEEYFSLCDYLADKFKRNTIHVTKADCHSPSTLTVDLWDAVSSLEWPIVIYVGITKEQGKGSGETRIAEAYRCYRASSRAIMKILQIIAYKIEEVKKSEDEMVRSEDEVGHSEDEMGHSDDEMRHSEDLMLRSKEEMHHSLSEEDMDCYKENMPAGYVNSVLCAEQLRPSVEQSPLNEEEDNDAMENVDDSHDSFNQEKATDVLEKANDSPQCEHRLGIHESVKKFLGSLVRLPVKAFFKELAKNLSPSSKRWPDIDINEPLNYQVDRMSYLPNQFELGSDYLKLIKECGRGEFGQVWRGSLKIGNGQDEWVEVAAKCPVGQNQIHYLSLWMELKLLTHLKAHVNVLRVLGACTSRLEFGEFYVITEFCHFGSLRNYLRAHQKEFESSLEHEKIAEKLLSYAYQAAKGLEHLSAQKIIHRDIALRNLLLTTGHIVKVSDFGLAVISTSYSKKAGSNDLLPLLWMAPEALDMGDYSTKSDVWSFGMALWEIFSLGRHPQPDVMPTPYYFLLRRQRGRILQPQLATIIDIYALMQTCWNDDPDRRPTFTECVGEIKKLMSQSALADLHARLTEAFQEECDLSEKIRKSNQQLPISFEKDLIRPHLNRFRNQSDIGVVGYGPTSFPVSTHSEYLTPSSFSERSYPAAAVPKGLYRHPD